MHSVRADEFSEVVITPSAEPVVVVIVQQTGTAPQCPEAHIPLAPWPADHRLHSQCPPSVCPLLWDHPVILEPVLPLLHQQLELRFGAKGWQAARAENLSSQPVRCWAEGGDPGLAAEAVPAILVCLLSDQLCRALVQQGGLAEVT